MSCSSGFTFIISALLATDQLNVVGSYFKICFAQRHYLLASPLSVWFLNFVELD